MTQALRTNLRILTGSRILFLRSRYRLKLEVEYARAPLPQTHEPHDLRADRCRHADHDRDSSCHHVALGSNRYSAHFLSTKARHRMAIPLAFCCSSFPSHSSPLGSCLVRGCTFLSAPSGGRWPFSYRSDACSIFFSL